MATPQRLLHALIGWWLACCHGWCCPPVPAAQLRIALLWGTCAILRFRLHLRLRPGLPRLARRLRQAQAEQQPLLQELALLRQAHGCAQRAQLSGGYDPDGLDELITIAEALEIEHGWDALLVDQWLERLGLWDQEP